MHANVKSEHVKRYEPQLSQEEWRFIQFVVINHSTGQAFNGLVCT